MQKKTAPEPVLLRAKSQTDTARAEVDGGARKVVSSRGSVFRLDTDWEGQVHSNGQPVFRGSALFFLGRT